MIGWNVVAHTTFDGYEAGVLYAPEGLIQRIIPEYPVDSINIVAQLSVEVRDGEPESIVKVRCIFHHVNQVVGIGVQVYLYCEGRLLQLVLDYQRHVLLLSWEVPAIYPRGTSAFSVRRNCMSCEKG